ncbi:DUF6927 domain-containing protein [Phenylobacterium conjunctum]|uniref:DUF6927 domain-containing protein n=1 Tax=Phenylobacterium conjunctum TaxID=1298959 RepID=A0ABW3TB53_9CAUL
MGWLYMRSLAGYATPKAYLDAQFTYDRDTGCSRVLASSLVGRRTYYAAVEWITAASGAREVWGLVCLVRHNPRDREGLVFGYKDMSESMGPCESECPARILNLLTATENTYALDWRARCRSNLALKARRAAKPTPKPGDVVVLAEPLQFRDGRTFSRFEAVAWPGRRRGRLVFRSELGGLYRIPKLKDRVYLIEGKASRTRD